MSSEVINVEKRETRGKRRARRMRAEGKIPAVVYGHGEETMSVTIPAEDIEAAIRHRAHLVQLEGAVKDSALLKEIQWDAFGNHILHVDFTRVDAKEAVDVTLEVVLRGDAPGTHHGGVVEHHTRSIEISCPANAIPENLTININHLEVGDSIKVGDIEVPAGAVLKQDVDTVVVACVEPVERDDEAEQGAPAGEAEPEVIGRKSEDEGADA